MNQQELNYFRNSIQRKVIRKLTVKRNVINLNTHNSWKHEMIKCRIAYELQKLNKQFITEAPISSNKHQSNIVDVLNLDDAQAIEILVSETEQELEWKMRNVPDCLEVVAVKDWNDLFDGHYKIIKHSLL